VTKQARDLASILAEILPEKSPQNLDGKQRRRLEIILRSHLGQSQAEICSALGCSKDMARYWMAIAQTPQIDSWQDTHVGRPKRVSKQYLKRLEELVTSNPQNYGYAFKRWTAKCLSQHLAKELNIEISDRHINRLLKQMGLSTKNSQASSLEDKSTSQKKKGIAIEDLNPASCPQLDDLLWWFQNQN
jgi:transposase